MTITYEYEGALYINLTNRCDCDCEFCIRKSGDGGIYTDNLWLPHEPSREEVAEDVFAHALASYREVVFCGYGEPTFRLHDLLWLCDEMQKRVLGLPPVRLNTNGHANLIHGRDVTPEFQGRLDIVSISLNASNREEYVRMCRPKDGESAYDAMLLFAERAKKFVPTVILTVVDRGNGTAELDACRKIAEDLGVQLRIRPYIP